MSIETRLAELEREHSDFRKVHVSRRGAEGGRGETGAVGPAGPPADVAQVVTQAVEAAKAALVEEFGTLHKFLNAKALVEIINQQLKLAGVIDEDGKAVLIPGIPGPAGAPGRDSTAIGATGLPGRDAVDGKPGRDAKIAIGHVVAGAKASVSVREENGVQVLDFVLPRGEKGETGTSGQDGVDSNVQGPVGPEGREGIQGIPGAGLSKQDVIDLVFDLKRRKSI